ncbi:MAG: type II toxin-antitoxin system RelE/ParE family toxin [Rhodomicrobium sp.]
MTQVIWTDPALDDLERIKRYIAQFNLYAAHDMAERILEAGDSLMTFPYRGRAVPNTNLRETTIARPYIIRYRIERDRVYILRVRHSARRR